jgi:hypothetical protein
MQASASEADCTALRKQIVAVIYPLESEQAQSLVPTVCDHGGNIVTATARKRRQSMHESPLQQWRNDVLWPPMPVGFNSKDLMNRSSCKI